MIMTHKTLIAAVAGTAFALAGCSSTGGASGDPLPGDPPNAIGTTAGNGGGVVSKTGYVVTDLGNQMASSNVPLLSPQATQGMGGALAKTGTAITDLGNGVTDGLGQLGGLSPDPIGTTLASTGNVVTDLGQAGISLGSGIAGIGHSAALNNTPVTGLTDALGNAVAVAGQGGVAGGTILGQTFSGGPVQQMTMALSTAVTPITNTAGETAQTLGMTTGLGGPVSGLLGTVGGAVSMAGSQISSAAPTPAAKDLGGVAGAVGTTVAGFGGFVTTGSGSGPSAGNPLGGLLRSLGGAVGSSGAGTAAGGNPLASATGLLGSLGSVTSH